MKYNRKENINLPIVVLWENVITVWKVLVSRWVQAACQVPPTGNKLFCL